MIKIASPIIKWVGGKRQLVDKIKEKMPNTYGTYYEPFFGGGAVFFDICPKKAVINDSNCQLISLYKQIKTQPQQVIRYLNILQKEYNDLSDMKEKDDYYISKREEFNIHITKNILNNKTAALFIFLNKSGFNGLYRVNSKGLFNVPSAHKQKINIFDEENILEVSKILKKCDIKLGDFETACKNAKEKDLVFFDSPYYDTFDTYQANGFSESDHKRLFNLFDELSNKGVYCIATNSNTEFIKTLYNKYIIEVVDVKRMINCDATKRAGKEIIITNY